MTVSSDNAGDFMADFDGVYDFIAWDEAIVAVVENDIEIHQHVYPQQALLVRASPLGFAIGYATPNAPITVTFFASDGTTIKETSSMDTNHNGMFISMIENDIEENDMSRWSFLKELFLAAPWIVSRWKSIATMISSPENPYPGLSCVVCWIHL